MFNRRALLLMPVAVAMAGGVGLLAMLRRMERGQFDPHALPNPLIGHPALPLPGFPDQNQSARLVNFFASWCAPCAEEASGLAALGKYGLPIWGIAYKDKPDATAQFLARTGNPYTVTGQDADGRIAIDWGVTGVPETFLIDADNSVRAHWSGVVTEALWPGIRQVLTSR